jgi:hypothetical protein
VSLRICLTKEKSEKLFSGDAISRSITIKGKTNEWVDFVLTYPPLKKPIQYILQI